MSRMRDERNTEQTECGISRTGNKRDTEGKEYTGNEEGKKE
jgi:hypothetical protein